jgi:uncharacterized membrane protein
MSKVPSPLRAVPRHSRHWLRRFSFLGLSLGTVFFCLSLLPSLLPRPWLFQGLICGISFAIGYGLGTSLSSLIRWLTEAELPTPLKQNFWRSLAILAPVGALTYLYLGSVWQNEVRQLVGEPAVDGRHMLRIAVTSLLTFLVLLACSRGIRRLSRFLNRQIDRVLPRRLAVALGAGFVTLLLFWVVTGVFYDFFVSQANNIYSVKNNQTPEGVKQPVSSSRSGSEDSFVAWDTVGYQGKRFVSGGPTPAQLANYTGQPPTEQIRIYAGLKSASTPEARAALVVQEMKRTGAFERKIIVIANVTGTGWLEPQSVDSIEYMYGGNSAIVAQQYSYLPSWISFLVDQENAQNAGRALFDAVYGAWADMPVDSRPKLISYGLSLGSFGGQAAYSGVNDMRVAVDGALFLGTPNDTQLWRTVTDNRDPGTPEWQPTYQDGTAVRFAATNQDITANTDTWQSPRILYVQHASDPVVWFNFDLLLNKPAWLSEKRGPDVSPATRWYPFITFLQVGIDQFFGTSVPNGHGHNYPNTIVNAWGAVAAPENWNESDAARLQKIIDAYTNE